jgi:hypothetical protein
MPCSQLLLRSQFVLWRWKGYDNNFECLFDIMFIIKLVCIKQEGLTFTVLKFTLAAESMANEWPRGYLFLMNILR